MKDLICQQCFSRFNLLKALEEKYAILKAVVVKMEEHILEYPRNEPVESERTGMFLK